MESDESPFPEVAGFIIHGISGTMVIPLVALVLLIVSFFAKVPEGAKWAGMVFGGVVVQVACSAIFAHGLPFLGFVHGFWALLIVRRGVPGGAAGRRDRRRRAVGVRGRRGPVMLT